MIAAWYVKLSDELRRGLPAPARAYGTTLGWLRSWLGEGAGVSGVSASQRPVTIP